MILRELSKLVEELLSPETSEKNAKKADLKTLLKQLRVEEKSLKEDLTQEIDEEKKQKLTNKIALAHSQRKKGLTALAAIKKI